ncbi:23S rRNA (adenine(1618)-N(6))-methyltransferase RlmF [Marinomonas sp. 2405UD68-3]|uniref:23S rRNA (adenine(1618)-N(6))-methyltransferase RlmF n=1 Tax=Marinomonas sp. 2405UD68-3 TaxID=3391835 RepID=UPI0039C971FF
MNKVSRSFDGKKKQSKSLKRVTEKASLRNNKLELHPRNPHKMRYDFALLADSCSELTQYVAKNAYGNESIDFADPKAVKTLNKALLSHFYGVFYWDIPSGFLCPPIPGRADYIHYLADLLAYSNNGVIPRGSMVQALDVGVGANCVYPIIGTREYGWKFIGSDINATAVDAAKAIVKSNPSLSSHIQIRLQNERSALFDGVWGEKDRFDVTLCNPPFHTSESAMKTESERKWKGVKGTKTSTLNFGGQSDELWCDGGEEAFICRMIKESKRYHDRCYWFTSLVAKQSRLPALYRELKKIGAVQVRTIDMAQGKKVSRFVAWSFLEPAQQDYWQDTYWIA